jgi:hypothetical protein
MEKGAAGAVRHIVGIKQLAAASEVLLLARFAEECICPKEGVCIQTAKRHSSRGRIASTNLGSGPLAPILNVLAKANARAGSCCRNWI